MPKTPITDPIASLELIWIRRDGQQYPISAKLGRPYHDADSTWACPVILDGVDGQYPDIYGEGAVQALALATTMLYRSLSNLLDRGEHLVDPVSHDAWDIERLDATFGRTGEKKTTG